MILREKILLLILVLALSITFDFTFAQTTFAVIGDYGDDDADERLVTDLVNSWNVDFIITTGDNSYDSTQIDNNIGQYYSDWIGNYNGSYGSGSSANKFFPSLGNHDYSDGVGIYAYLDYFTLPGIDGNSSGNERYYDYIIDNIHFFAINSNDEEPDGINASSLQANWLQNAMTNSTSHWNIVFFHHPPYSSGQHQSSSVMRWDFLQWGADAIFNGHDHDYERLEVDGLVYFVNGLGGRNIRSFDSTNSYSMFRYNGDFGAQKVTANGDELTFEFYNSNDELIDSRTIIKGGLPVELVFFKGSLNGNTVELCWRTETEVNNYGFDIERTKDNSDWETIGFVEGHGNSNSPKEYSFVDENINRYGSYFYRLKQIDNDGTHDYSDVVSVEFGIPYSFYLSQNYPNPFNPLTKIEFTIPEKQMVSLKIFNSIGELVDELVNEEKGAGNYSVDFNATGLASGIYVYRLQAGDFISNKKMILLK